jgi:hypothetical protein
MDAENIIIGLAIAGGAYLVYKNYVAPKVSASVNNQEQNAGSNFVQGIETELGNQAAGIGDDFLSAVGSFADDE